MPSDASDAECGQETPRASEEMTIAEALAVCGSANHDANGKTHNDLLEVFGEAHPAVAGQLVRRVRAGIDDSTGFDRGTASGSEHPDWNRELRKAIAESKPEGYDV